MTQKYLWPWTLKSTPTCFCFLHFTPTHCPFSASLFLSLANPFLLICTLLSLKYFCCFHFLCQTSVLQPEDTTPYSSHASFIFLLGKPQSSSICKPIYVKSLTTLGAPFDGFLHTLIWVHKRTYMLYRTYVWLIFVYILVWKLFQQRTAALLVFFFFLNFPLAKALIYR